jgi:hypothetical protein
MKWISIKDKLPDDKDTVLIYLATGKGGFCMDVAFFDRGQFWCHGKAEPFATHWMPLPIKPMLTEEEAKELGQATGFTYNTKIRQDHDNVC